MEQALLDQGDGAGEVLLVEVEIVLVHALQNLSTQKLKAILANPAIRRFLIHYCVVVFCALNLQNLMEYYEILAVRISAPQNILIMAFLSCVDCSPARG